MNSVIKLDRQGVFRIQYLKLVNYYRSALPAKWMPSFMYGNERTNEEAFMRFYVDIGYKKMDPKAWWLKRPSLSEKWAEGEIKVSREPSKDLGEPFELYIAIAGGIITLKEASRLLSIDIVDLYQLKLRHVFDEIVIAIAFSRLLAPRTMWSEASLDNTLTFELEL